LSCAISFGNCRGIRVNLYVRPEIISGLFFIENPESAKRSAENRYLTAKCEALIRTYIIDISQQVHIINEIENLVNKLIIR